MAKGEGGKSIAFLHTICKNMGVEIITSHLNADFDACASMVAASKLYPEAKMVFPGSQEKKVRDFLENFFKMPLLRLRDIDTSSISRLIVVDTKSPGRLGPLAEVLERKDVEVHLFDHHAHGSSDIHGTEEVVEQVGATATIFSEILKARRKKPSAIEATLLMLGIYEETGHLLYPTTTERDIMAAAYLLKCGANLNIVARYMKDELGPAEVRLLNECMATATEEAIGGLRVLTATASSEHYVGDAAHLCHRLLDMTHADAAIMMLRLEGKILVVGRSRTPQINMAEALEPFGGGGHPTAASATVEDSPLELLQERVVQELQRTIKPGKFAEHVMTSPVITIGLDESVAAAEAKMTRFEVNVLPVIKGKDYLGLISREDVEKATHHGYGSRPVGDFANTDASTAERYTPVREVERRMVERNQRFMPVVVEGRVIGAITRTDLLRSLYDDYLRRTGIKEDGGRTQGMVVKNVRSWLRNRFPEDASNLLKLAGETADSMGHAAYLVGGTVRDLLRGQENLDMDFVVEGDGIEFARQMAGRTGAKVYPHERFKTAKVVMGQLRVDIATARTEHYDSPASLPSVTASSIKKDLYRRDFTINTLAVRLNQENFGQLVDFFGGQRDIKERTIRVLHNLSLVEDPTRAFRAVRFAERFGFRISRHTRNLISSAIKMRLFEKLSGTRIYDELALVFEESDPLPIIRQLEKYGLLKVINPSLELTAEMEGLFTSVHDTLVWFGMLFTDEHPQKTTLYLTALLSPLKTRERMEAAERLSVPARTLSCLVRQMEEAHNVLRQMPLGDRAKVYDALEHLSIESILLTMAIARNDEAKKEIASYLLELRKVNPMLSGTDLKEMGIEPGPVYSEILKALRHGRLRLKLETRQDEENFVKEFMNK